MQRQEEYSKLVIELTCGINLVIVLEEILSCNWYTYICHIHSRVISFWKEIRNPLWWC